MFDESVTDEIDAICDEYEEKRVSGEIVSLEFFLGRAAEEHRTPLLKWLLLLEKEIDSASQSTVIEEFLKACPEYESTVREVLSQPEAFTDLFPDIEGYKVQSLIERGGQGAVFEAIQARTGQMVAIKLVTIDRQSIDKQHERAIENLKNEIRVLASLQHPNVIKIFDAGECDEGFYYVMQLVKGGSLADRMKTISQVEAAKHIVQIANAVESANRMGILHLDIKPGNILFDQSSNQPLLTDFGLARIISADENEARSPGGTPAFMAPEQASKGMVDARTDIFGLGATLFALLTGKPPRITETDRDEESENLGFGSENGREINSHLKVICGKCLEVDPNRRYQHVDELIAELNRFFAREDGRRVARMGNRTISTSILYFVINSLVGLVLFFRAETNPIIEIGVWLAILSMYGVVFFTLGSASAKNANAEELVAAESLFSIWCSKMFAAITIVIALRVFLFRMDLGLDSGRYAILLSYPMFCTLTGTVSASIAPRFWKGLYYGAAFWWILSLCIIWVATVDSISFLVPFIYGLGASVSSYWWGTQLMKFGRENTAPTELITVARTLPYEK